MSGNRPGLLHEIRQWWGLSVALSITMVRVRKYRLRLMLGATIAALLMLGFGANTLAPWLMVSPWRFFAYWGGCFLLCLFMLALAWIEIRSLAVARAVAETQLLAELHRKAHEATRGTPSPD